MTSPYRPEIDGLRTVAVVLVVLHHLGWSILPGGYIGVDVFFVISGYLITSMLRRELDAGRLSIGQFYKRRIVRLAPAYYLMICVVSVAAIFVALPTELVRFSESVQYSGLFAANFYMWQEVGGYFNTQAHLVPLLHLWSLAVEEQFYIIWPAALLVFWLTLGHRGLKWGTALLVLCGLLFSQWGVDNYRAAAYFFMPTRLFELALGGWIALLVHGRHCRVMPPALGWLGAGLIVVSAATFTKQSAFPGVLAAVPCVGTCLIILAARNGAGTLGRLLSYAPMVYLGKLSYPVYLWHWPLISLLGLLAIEINAQIGLAVFLASFLLAAATYHGIEMPARALGRLSVARVVAIGFVIPTSTLVALSQVVIHSNGFPSRFSSEINRMDAALRSSSSQLRGGCFEAAATHPASAEKCVLGVGNREVDFLLIGDSHANHYTGMIDIMAKQAGLRGYDITQSNTIFLPGVIREYGHGGGVREQVGFAQRNDYLSGLISSQRYGSVILAGAFVSHMEGARLKEAGTSSSAEALSSGMRRALKVIIDSGAQPILIEGNPILEGVDHDCFLKAARWGTDQECSFSRALHNERFSAWKRLVSELKAEFPSLVIIQPDLVICDTSACNTAIDGVPIYRDPGHLNHTGSELLGALYSSRIGNPLDGRTYEKHSP